MYMKFVYWTIDKRPALVDKYIYFKLIFIAYVFLFWIATITVTILLTDYAGKSDEPEWYKTYIELRPDQAQEVVISWYLAIFFWGTIINVLRCYIISLAAPRKAKELFEKYQKIYSDYDLEYKNVPVLIEKERVQNEILRKQKKAKKFYENARKCQIQLDLDKKLKADLARFFGFFGQCSC